MIFMFFQHSLLTTPLAVVLKQTLGSLVTGSHNSEVTSLPRDQSAQEVAEQIPESGQAGPSWPVTGGRGGPHTFSCVPLSCVLWARWPCHLPSLPPPPVEARLRMCWPCCLGCRAGLRPGLERRGQLESPGPRGGGGVGRRAFWSAVHSCSSLTFHRSSG